MEGNLLALRYLELVHRFVVDIVTYDMTDIQRGSAMVLVVAAWLLVEGMATLVVEVEDITENFQMAGY